MGTCVFLPPGSQESGCHAEDEDGKCWCSKPMSEGGLEYIINGLAINCRPNQINPKEGDRTTFGCLWYRIWQRQVEEARQEGCTFYCVVFDNGGCGNSQKAEMEYLKINDIPFDTIKITAFLEQIHLFE